MNIEELRQLKEALELEQEYVAIEQFNYQKLKNASETKPLKDFIAEENTLDFVKKCEALIEKSVKDLADKGIPFDTIEIGSEIGFLSKKSFVDSAIQAYEKELDDNGYNNLVEKLKTESSNTYVPLTFKFNYILSGTDDSPVYDYVDQMKLNIDELNSTKVSGIVNINVFLAEMKKLGYDIQLMNYGEFNNIDDYFKAFQEHGFDTELEVICDLKKTNSLDSEGTEKSR